jgi:hypothetical protein
MQTVRPALRVGDHLLRGETHDGSNIFADERTREVARRLSGVDDCGAHSEQMLVTLSSVIEFTRARPGLGRDAFDLVVPLMPAGKLGHYLPVRYLCVFHVRHLDEHGAIKSATCIPRLGIYLRLLICHIRLTFDICLA